MPTYPGCYRLPTSYSTAIGRYITRFAALESALRHLIYVLLEVDRKMGRVAVRNPRIEDSLTMIRDLVALRSFQTTLDLNLLAKECKKLEKFRDKLAHGVWAKHPKSQLPVLQVTAGTYSEKPGGKSVKARIQPMALGVTVQNIRDHIRGVDFAFKAVMELAHELSAQHDASL